MIWWLPCEWVSSYNIMGTAIRISVWTVADILPYWSRCLEALACTDTCIMKTCEYMHSCTLSDNSSTHRVHDLRCCYCHSSSRIIGVPTAFRTGMVLETVLVWWAKMVPSFLIPTPIHPALLLPSPRETEKGGLRWSWQANWIILKTSHGAETLPEIESLTV